MAFVHASLASNGRHRLYEACLKRELYILNFIFLDATLLVFITVRGKNVRIKEALVYMDGGVIDGVKNTRPVVIRSRGD